MAASYCLLEQKPELIAPNMVEAVRADAPTAKKRLGESLVTQIEAQIRSRMVVPCPKCGHQNPFGSRFCNQDGSPLIPGLSAPSPADKGSGSPFTVRKLLAEPRFSKFSHLKLLYRTDYKTKLVEALKPWTRDDLFASRSKYQQRFQRDFADVALALFITLQSQMRFVALYDILHGLMIEGAIDPADKLLELYTPQRISLIYLVEEEAPSKVTVTGILRGGPLKGSVVGKMWSNLFGEPDPSYNKRLEDIASQIMKRLKS
jgi:hypothetical protein